jgi:hypothetical protein
MGGRKRHARSGFAVFVVCLWLLVPRAEAALVMVNCDAGSTIGGTLSSLKAGDTLVVS